MQRKFISRRSFLKCAGVGAVAAAGLLAGCGGSDSSSSTAASTASSAAAEPADPNKPYAGVTLYYAATDTEATGPEMQDIVAMVKEKTGINIEFNIIPKADTGEVDKRLVSLQAGDEAPGQPAGRRRAGHRLRHRRPAEGLLRRGRPVLPGRAGQRRKL